MIVDLLNFFLKIFFIYKIVDKLYNNEPSVDERHRHRYEVIYNSGYFWFLKINFLKINPSIVPKLCRAGLVFVGMFLKFLKIQLHLLLILGMGVDETWDSKRNVRTKSASSLLNAAGDNLAEDFVNSIF